MARKRAPDHLGLETQRWWLKVTREFELDDHHLKLLTLAGEAWDRCQEARERIAQDGAYLPDRFGQLRAHPAIAVERDSKIAFCRLLRELDLDVSVSEPKRPPMLRRYA